MTDMIYMNHASIGNPPVEVERTVRDYECLRSQIGRSSIAARELFTRGTLPQRSKHTAEAHRVEETWSGVFGLGATIGNLLNMSHDEYSVVFSFNTSAILHLLLSSVSSDSGALITTDVEHSSEIRCANSFWDGDVKVVSIRELLFSSSRRNISDKVQDRVDPGDTLLISHVCASLGSVLPVIELSKNIPDSCTIIVDGSHGPGNIEVNLKDAQVDFYVGSGHKWLSGPESSGYAYCSPSAWSRYGDRIRSELVSGVGVSYDESNNARDSRSYANAFWSIGTVNNILPLVGLQRSIRLFRKGGSSIDMGKSDINRKMFENKINSRQIDTAKVRGLKNRSSISPLFLKTSFRNDSSHIQKAIEEKVGIIAEVIGLNILRISFIGDEEEEIVDQMAESLSDFDFSYL